MRKLLLFGAGKIGRSFIGQLFSRSGYEVVFVDIDHTLIDELNNRRQYKVIIKDDKEEEILIQNVRGIHFSDDEKIIQEIATSSIMAVSVGKYGLKAVIPIISKGLQEREKKGKPAIDLIIAENMRNADNYIYLELKSLLPPGFPINQRLGLVETSIGKMVPIMPAEIIKKNPLVVYAETYNSLILDKKGFLNGIPDVDGLAPKENIKAWVDRKLFIHNFGHVATAYLGYAYNSAFVYTWEPLQVQEVYGKVYKAMKQSAFALQNLYPNEFSGQHLEKHILDLLKRFQNKHLCDTIFRVGCDLLRKLAPDDRVITPLRTAINFNLPFDRIADVLLKGMDFNASNENGAFFPSDETFFEEREKGIRHVLRSVCKLTDKEIHLLKKQV